jgi:hypothetical protein
MIMAQTILYYPRINIHDGAWLRNAILYWDEVSSIVPYEDYDNFSPELSYLQERGVYKPVYPQELFFSGVSEEFCNVIEKRIKAYKRSMIKKFHRTQNESVKIHRNKICAPYLHDLIHYKLPRNLLDFLIDEGFIYDYNCNGWMEIDSKVAHIYMRTLAEYLIKCSDKDTVLGTDTITHSREIYSNSRNRTNLRTQCCKINIVNCLPQPSKDVSFEDILDFKNRRKDELNAFRQKIRELEANIYNADSLELIRHYENQFIESWKYCSEDYLKVLKEEKITFYLGSLVTLVALPFVSELLTNKIGSNYTSVIQTGVSMINIGVGYYNYRNKINSVKTDGAFSYIFKAKREGIIRI